MKGRIAVAGGTVGVAALAVYLFAGSAGETAGMLPYRDAAAVAQGEAIYAEFCASCHGDALEGQVPNWREKGEDGRLPAPPHDESGHTWHHPDQVLVAITKFGSAEVVGGGYESDMIGFGEVLSDEEILAVLAFIKSTWPDEVIDMHNRRNQAASGG